MADGKATVWEFDVAAYPAGLSGLIDPSWLGEVGPGKQQRSKRVQLIALDLDEAFGSHAIRNRDMANGCLAGLWLMHNFLEESHEVSQKIETPTGSFWHGIMHRREGDFSNAHYWFRYVGQHPIFPALAAAGREFSADTDKDAEAAYLGEAEQWDAGRFVDLCEAVDRGRSTSAAICRRIACREWQLLFDFCYREAVGG